MNRYHYIDDQGNISDALPLAALHKIGLHPATKVLLEGSKQWTTLAEIPQGGLVVFPAPPLPPPAAITSHPLTPAAHPPVVSSAPPAEAKWSKSSVTKGCLGCLGVIAGIVVLLGIISAIFGPSNSGKIDSSKAQGRQPNPALARELHGWLSSGPWKCVDTASSKSGHDGDGIMRGATFEFTASQLRISGGGAEATHAYCIESVSKSANAGTDLVASLRIGSRTESLLKLEPEGGFEFAGMSWMKGAWTLKLARSQR